MNRVEDDLKPYEKAQARNEFEDYRIYWGTVSAVCILLTYVVVQGFLMLWAVSSIAALTTLVVLLGASLITLSFVQR